MEASSELTKHLQRRKDIPLSTLQTHHPGRSRFDDSRCAVGFETDHGDIFPDNEVLFGVQLCDKVS